MSTWIPGGIPYYAYGGMAGYAVPYTTTVATCAPLNNVYLPDGLYPSYVPQARVAVAPTPVPTVDTYTFYGRQHPGVAYQQYPRIYTVAPGIFQNPYEQMVNGYPFYQPYYTAPVPVAPPPEYLQGNVPVQTASVTPNTATGSGMSSNPQKNVVVPQSPAQQSSGSMYASVYQKDQFNPLKVLLKQPPESVPDSQAPSTLPIEQIRRPAVVEHTLRPDYYQGAYLSSHFESPGDYRPATAPSTTTPGGGNDTDDLIKQILKEVKKK
jgi:hypothetical protein